jgi:tetratricopeptide (TPR) repeat protein
VQDEIAGAIAGALRLTLADAPTRAAARVADREAYDLYLRGNWFRNRLSKDALFKAIEHFDRAIALDSTWAPAYAGKASAMGPLFYFRHVPREPGLTEMRAAARRALALDERLGEAHVAMGIVHFFYDWDWPAAGNEFRRATTLNPGDAHAWHHLANWMRAMGRYDEAIAARRRSLELDPLNARTAISLGRDYTSAGRLDLAADAYRRGVDIDSMSPLFLGTGPNLPVGLGEVYEQQGRHAEAVAEYLRVAARRRATPDELAAMRQAFADGGMRGFWRRWLAFEERTHGGAPRALVVARTYQRIGDDASAIAWLERAYAERDPGLVYLRADHEWRALRADPRVAAIIARMGLPR